MQYNAWCRNDGNHSTLNRGHVDWNADIIWKMRTELELEWDIVQGEISTLFAGLLTEIKSLLGGLKETLLGKRRSLVLRHEKKKLWFAQQAISCSPRA